MYFRFFADPAKDRAKYQKVPQMAARARVRVSRVGSIKLVLFRRNLDVLRICCSQVKGDEIRCSTIDEIDCFTMFFRETTATAPLKRQWLISFRHLIPRVRDVNRQNASFVFDEMRSKEGRRRGGSFRRSNGDRRELQSSTIRSNRACRWK